MSRKTEKPIMAAPDGDGRLDYAVAEGVTRVNGQKVTTPTVRLNAAEALQDLSLGRISLVNGGAGAAGGEG